VVADPRRKRDNGPRTAIHVARIARLALLLLAIACVTAIGFSADALPTIEAIVREARAALAQGKPQKAESLYRDLARVRPGSPEILSDLGYALHLQGKSSEAITWFKRALRIRELPGTLGLLAVGYCRLGQDDLAAPLLQKAKGYMGNTDLMGLLGPCYLQAGEPLDAVAVYRALVARRAAPADEYATGLAKAYFQASKSFARLLERAPDNGKYMEALETARRQALPDARGAMATALRDAPYLGKVPALGDLQELLPQHRQDAALLYVLTVLCGEFAMQTFRDCERQNGNSVAFRKLKAGMLASQRQDQQAILEYKSLITESPGDPDLHHELGLIYHLRGEWELALKEFQSERTAGEDNERAVAAISDCLVRLGSFQQITEHLQSALRKEFPPEWVLVDYATAQRGLGHLSDAIATLERATRLYPEGETLHYKLGRLYAEAGRRGQAAEQMAAFKRLKASSQRAPTVK
jgi:tetratricopeptide (TPR) repeat protein